MSRPRLDSRDKVTGATRYTADFPHRGLLHARIVPSLYAHAWIRGIDSADALAVPGVVAVLTDADLGIRHRDDMRMFEPLARSEATFAGQPVAVVIAESEAAAEDGAERVVVHAERIEPAVDLEAAMAPESVVARLTPLADPTDGQAGDGTSGHAAVGGIGAELEEEALSPNVFNRQRYASGDLEAAFSSADAIVAGRFATSWVYQAYLEPHAATAWIEPDGTLAVETGTQGTFYVRSQLARMYGLPQSRIRVAAPPLGGAFGSKMLVVEPIAAGAALMLGRPVRLALTRLEDFAATNPAPAAIIELRIGARSDGSLTALEARIIFDAGAYNEWSVEGVAAILVANGYRWSAFDIRAYGVRTNRFGTGAYRGPGGPQGITAIEALVDELADQLGIDAADLRLQNLVAEGDPMVDGEAWPLIGAEECLEAVRSHPIWTGRANVPPDEGVGLAMAVWPGGKGAASAVCRLNTDGTLTVSTGIADMTGAQTGFAFIAAEAFGLPVEAVDVVSVDSSGAPPTSVTGGSAAIYAVGAAVKAAAAEARQQLLEHAAREWEISIPDLEIVHGVVQPHGSPARGRSVAEFAAELADFGVTPVEGHCALLQKSLAPSTAAHLVHVRLDRETGEVNVLGHVVAQDVGRALNPALIEGQMRGGAVQGLGWALWERMMHDDTGQLVTGSFLDYTVPRASHLPNIETLMVEVPAPDGPFGAKGIGEASVLAVPAAVGNAITAAGGPRLRELPMTPSRVWAAMNKLSA